MAKRNQSSRQTVKRFFELLSFDKKITLKALFPVIINSIIWSAILIIIKDITNIISGGRQGNLWLYTISFAVLSFLYRVVIVIARNRTHVVVRPFWRQCFYKKYMKRYLEFDNNEVEKIGTGRLISIVDKGFHTHIAQVTDIIQSIIPNIIQILISITFIFFVNYWYGSIVMLSLILIGIIVYKQQNKANKYRKVRNELNIGIMRNFVKILMSKFEVLTTNKGEHEIEKLTKSLDENIMVNKKIMDVTVRVELILRFFVDGIAFFMILLFGFGFLQQSINIGEFASLIGIVYFLDKALSQLKIYHINFLMSMVEIQKLWDTFDSIKKMPDIRKGKDFIYKKGNISLQKISFTYDRSRFFKDFSFNIKGGTKTAFVGESGGGKTTLIKLLAGYIKPTKGDISIDGQKLGKMKLADYYKHIGYLTQEPSVFDGTIYENLTYALDEKQSQKELLSKHIDEVIRLSKCEFIYEFEKGLETEIGERGVRLSGGQKQRLAIAKIMLKDPNIILLDEPTSALDSFNEEQISMALHNLFKGKTVVVVAHRLQTVKQSDRICYIEGGQIVEDGTHHELVKLNGKYKKMLDLQSGF